MKPIPKTPWIEYFDLLQKYRQCGYLEITGKNEAYITLAAILTLANVSPDDLTQERRRGAQIWEAVKLVVRRLYIYSSWLTAGGPTPPVLAVHVVGDNPPHEPAATIVVSQPRSWYSPWRKRLRYDVVNYSM